MKLIFSHAALLFEAASAESGGERRSPLPVLRKDVIVRLRYGMAREPALGVVPLRRRASGRAGLERIGRGVVIEHRPSPTAAVGEPLAVLLHDVHVDQSARNTR